MSCTLLYISFLHASKMCAFVWVVIPILEAVVAECALPSLLHLCEVVEDGSALAGWSLSFLGMVLVECLGESFLELGLVWVHERFPVTECFLLCML